MERDWGALACLFCCASSPSAPKLVGVEGWNLLLGGAGTLSIFPKTKAELRRAHGGSQAKLCVSSRSRDRSPSVGRWGFPDERSGDEINWEQYLTMKRSDERTNTSPRCNKYLFQILPLFLKEIKSYRCRWNLAHYISLLLRGKHESEFGVHYSQPQFYIFIMYICIH